MSPWTPASSGAFSGVAGRLEHKVAVITGAARDPGRSAVTRPVRPARHRVTVS
jgi:hypothetical protein